jgi:hypothetical protein
MNCDTRAMLGTVAGMLCADMPRAGENGTDANPGEGDIVLWASERRSGICAWHGDEEPAVNLVIGEPFVSR